MNPIEIVTFTSDTGFQDKQFKIRLNNGFAYMRTKDMLNPNNSDRVVIVDSNKFLALWQNDPSKQCANHANGNESIWRKDYKFHYAEEGFADGSVNPVPLATVHCYLSDMYWISSPKLLKKFVNGRPTPYCCFTDGITRTIWLLANGAKCFPVLTDSNSYELLNKEASAYSLDEIADSPTFMT